jgi:hypothetical protein
MEQMTFIDCAKGGLILQTGGEGESKGLVANNIRIYGESEAEDCPEDGSDCWCQKKAGMFNFGANTNKKDLHPTSSSALPIYKIKSYGAWGPWTDL